MADILEQMAWSLLAKGSITHLSSNNCGLNFLAYSTYNSSPILYKRSWRQCGTRFLPFHLFSALTFDLGSFATCRLSRNRLFFWLPYFTLAVVVFLWIPTPSSIISGFCRLGSDHCIFFATLSQYVRGNMIRFGIFTSWIILNEKVWLQLSPPACWLLSVRIFYLFSSQADSCRWKAFHDLL